MIEELRIRDLGVIADATLELSPGFTVISGETGAGKTMVVTALGLLMGDRADSATVRSGASAARVSGLVHTTDPAVHELVENAGGVIDDTDVTLARTVSAEGRSRAAVGGSTAPVSTLTKLAERLFTVHGQNDQLRLRSSAAQRNMLDKFAGEPVLQTLASYQNVHEQRRALAAQSADLVTTHEARRAEAERLRAELEEIATVDPQPNEETELKHLIDRLSNIEALRAATAGALNALSTDGEDPYATDAGTLIESAVTELERVADADPKLEGAAQQLRAISAQVRDVARDLLGYASDLDNEGPGELVRAHERLSALNELFRRYGAGSAEVLAYSEAAAIRLTELDGDDSRISEISAALLQLESEENELAAQLTSARTAAAMMLSARVSEELRQLALPDAQLTVQVSQTERGVSGADEVQLLLQPHPGAPARPVAKSASGGELSRVMLAIEVVVAQVDPVPTFVFDEVDAGIGGAAAIEIGRRLAQLARTSQVITVTHLAQVAAFAEKHIQVVKDSTGGFTESSCRTLEGEDRLAEIARLLSGLSDSENALAHARELLDLGAMAE